MQILIALAMAAGVASMLAAAPQNRAPRSARETLDYDRVLAEVLPFEVSDAPWASDAQWKVRVRILPAFEEEFAFTIVKKYKGGIDASVTRLVDGSIQRQLERLSRSNKSLSSAAAASRIRRHRYEVDDKTCAALADVADAFAKLKIDAAISDALQMDATHYDVLVESRMRSLTLSVAAPDPSDVISWADGARTVLTSCAPR